MNSPHIRSAPPGLAVVSETTVLREAGSFSPAKLDGWLLIIDSCAVLLAAMASWLVSAIVQNGMEAPHILTMFIGLVIVIASLKSFDLYKFSISRSRFEELRLILSALTLSFLIILAMAFAYSSEIKFSRVWFICWYSVSALTLASGRLLTWHIIHSLAVAGKLRRRVAVYGTGPQAERLIESLREKAEPWISIVGVFDDRGSARTPQKVGLAVSGSIGRLVSLCRQNKVDDVLIALPWSADTRILAVMRRLENLPVNIRTAPDMINFSIPNVSVDSFLGMAVLDIEPHRLSGPWSALKAVEDYVITTIMLVLLSPLMAIIALSVKLTSPGPVIYRQPRLGLNNRVFHVMKFRSMYHGRPNESGTPQATKGDRRITSIGRFLRKTSLDELPQLFNVLEGSMSLVGPRPHAIAHNELYGDVVDRYFVRHRVKPGITGWAQVNGYRGETEVTEKMQKRIEYDIEYIQRWSPLFDLRIIVKTVLVVFFQKTAY
jgi:Undecaprenyl-phosphate glucose phosphotransferase